MVTSTVGIVIDTHLLKAEIFSSKIHGKRAWYVFRLIRCFSIINTSFNCNWNLNLLCCVSLEFSEIQLSFIG